MASTARRALSTIFIVGIVVIIINMFLTLSNQQSDGVSEVDRQKLRQQLDLLNAQAKLQGEREEKLQVELSNVQAQLQQAGKALDAGKGEINPATIAKPLVDNSPPKEPPVGAKDPVDDEDNLVLPILVFACNRAAAITQALDDLIKYRPSKEKFPIIVTRDCAHEETRIAVEKYKDVIHKHIVQPDTGPVRDLDTKEKKLQGYFKISRHYKWALGQVFDEMKYKAAIIMEDDLNIAPDFYEYFSATYHLLKEDASLYCVSAWNDNGKAPLIEKNSELLYRSDFFPGLGWMLLDSLWDEYRDKWPRGFWDDWIRQEDQRHGRSCIRPEVSRTHTFGEKGVSLGLFYKTHLKFIVLNEDMVEWTKMDLSYLKRENYDEKYTEAAFSSQLINLKDLEQASRDKTYPSVRIIYSTKPSFKTIAKALTIMDDFKDGVPRTAYRGIVSIIYKGVRVYLTPPPDWTKYDPSW